MSGGGQTTACMERSVGNSVECALFFQLYVGSGDWTLVVRFMQHVSLSCVTQLASCPILSITLKARQVRFKHWDSLRPLIQEFHYELFYPFPSLLTRSAPGLRLPCHCLWKARITSVHHHCPHLSLSCIIWLWMELVQTRIFKEGMLSFSESKVPQKIQNCANS